jgi:hypothetical protein
MWTKVTLAVLLLQSMVAWPAEKIPDKKQAPVKVGPVTLVDRHISIQSGFVLDSEGTVHLLTLISNGEKQLLRVSRQGAVEQLLIASNGWPYILTKKGKIFAFDKSWKTRFKIKAPYAFSRVIWRFPYALSSGLGLYLLNFLLESAPLPDTTSHLGRAINLISVGAILYYGYDISRSFLSHSRTTFGTGGNFFTHQIASNVDSVTWDEDLSDFRITYRGKHRWSEAPEDSFLSQLAPSYTSSDDCAKWLLGLMIK